MTLHICRQNHRTNLNRTPSRSAHRLCAPVAPCCQLVLDLDAKQAGNKRRSALPPLPPCHRDNAPVAPLLVVSVKQANNERQACAATVTATMRPFCCWLCCFPSCRRCQAGRRRTLGLRRRRSTMPPSCPDEGPRVYPPIARQSRSPAPLSPPHYHHPIPFATVRAPLAPASSPSASVVNRVKMWPLGRRLALRDSGLMPIRRLLARLSPPHLCPPILLAPVRTLLSPASTPPVVIFV